MRTIVIMCVIALVVGRAVGFARAGMEMRGRGTGWVGSHHFTLRRTCSLAAPRGAGAAGGDGEKNPVSGQQRPRASLCRGSLPHSHAAAHLHAGGDRGGLHEGEGHPAETRRGGRHADQRE
jgi:hypothetical protein